MNEIKTAAMAVVVLATSELLSIGLWWAGVTVVSRRREGQARRQGEGTAPGQLPPT